MVLPEPEIIRECLVRWAAGKCPWQSEEHARVWTQAASRRVSRQRRSTDSRPLLQAVVKLSTRQRAELIQLTKLFLSDRTRLEEQQSAAVRRLHVSRWRTWATEHTSMRCKPWVRASPRWRVCQESLDEQKIVQLRKMLLSPPAARAAAYEVAQLTEELHVRGPPPASALCAVDWPRRFCL